MFLLWLGEENEEVGMKQTREIQGVEAREAGLEALIYHFPP